MKKLFLFFVVLTVLVSAASADVFTTSVNLSVSNQSITLFTESGVSSFSCGSDSNNTREISLVRSVQSSSSEFRTISEGISNLRSDLNSRENYFALYNSIFPKVAVLNASLELCRSRKDYKPDFDASQSQLASLVTRHNQLQADYSAVDGNWKVCEKKRSDSFQGTLSGIAVGAVGASIIVWAITRKKSVEEKVGRE